ncbi:hypothetical protein CROQUDRAFT_668755 [Cronartium quercuum f. sp. fusiforme G11]|uniref:Uncharacterized protein n=1 Tax=Cronartium quercuum f. sp. fusiforme G11 TaxID=708437 RepID=A0A9P6TGR7_9BASI|nr:hypothetical protein CROQUDRAFT_668755 [Cronartium quercuum f. sp. fusiforme G11]
MEEQIATLTRQLRVARRISNEQSKLKEPARDSGRLTTIKKGDPFFSMLSTSTQVGEEMAMNKISRNRKELSPSLHSSEPLVEDQVNVGEESEEESNKKRSTKSKKPHNTKTNDKRFNEDNYELPAIAPKKQGRKKVNVTSEIKETEEVEKRSKADSTKKKVTATNKKSKNSVIDHPVLEEKEDNEPAALSEVHRKRVPPRPLPPPPPVEDDEEEVEEDVIDPYRVIKPGQWISIGGCIVNPEEGVQVNEETEEEEEVEKVGVDPFLEREPRAEEPKEKMDTKLKEVDQEVGIVGSVVESELTPQPESEAEPEPPKPKKGRPKGPIKEKVTVKKKGRPRKRNLDDKEDIEERAVKKVKEKQKAVEEQEEEEEEDISSEGEEEVTRKAERRQKEEDGDGEYSVKKVKPTKRKSITPTAATTATTAIVKARKPKAKGKVKEKEIGEDDEGEQTVIGKESAENPTIKRRKIFNLKNKSKLGNSGGITLNWNEGNNEIEGDNNMLGLPPELSPVKKGGVGINNQILGNGLIGRGVKR